jgi:hypothetical protein
MPEKKEKEKSFIEKQLFALEITMHLCTKKGEI